MDTSTMSTSRWPGPLDARERMGASGGDEPLADPARAEIGGDMRTLRLSLAGTIIFMLLGVLSSTVSAQDPDAATWTHVTGSTVEGEWTVEGTPARWEDSVEHRPTRSQTFTVEWSDPRLPATMHIDQDAVLHHGDMTSYADYMFVFADSLRLEDADGAWVGSGRGVSGSDGTIMLYELTGEGAYEGLSALLDRAFDPDTMAVDFDGFIFEADVPWAPALAEPPAE
jgi:hypothetical protein